MVNQSAYALGTNRLTIRELAEYGNMRASVVGNENIFDFSIGNPSMPTPAEVTDVMRDILQNMDPLQIHSYTSAPGDFATRQAIAEDLNRRFHTDASAEDLFIGCGAAPELTSVIRALAWPGSEFLAVAPYFPEYKPYVEEQGATFKVVPPDVPAFQIRLEAVEQLLTPKTSALILNSPNNPAGTVYTRQTLVELAALLTQKSEAYGHPIYIIADEPYRELVYDGVEVPFIPTIYPNTVVCYSYSKSISLPGERNGYIYVPKAAADASAVYAAIVGAARGSGHVCAPSFMQKVIARCAHLQPELSFYDRNRKALYEGLTAAGYETAKPDGAFYLFVKAPGGDAYAFMEKAKEKDVLIVPGDDFGCPGYFRACYCVPLDKILRSLPLFRELIEA